MPYSYFARRYAGFLTPEEMGRAQNQLTSMLDAYGMAPNAEKIELVLFLSADISMQQMDPQKAILRLIEGLNGRDIGQFLVLDSALMYSQLLFEEGRVAVAERAAASIAEDASKFRIDGAFDEVIARCLLCFLHLPVELI